jgi:hypothetical protein
MMLWSSVLELRARPVCCVLLGNGLFVFPTKEEIVIFFSSLNIMAITGGIRDLIIMFGIERSVLQIEFLRRK